MVFAELVLGLIARYEGKAEEAESRLNALLRAIPAGDGDPPPLFLPIIYLGLGYTAELRGDPRSALRLHSQGLAVAVRIDAPRDMAFCLEGLASAASLMDHPADAARFLGAAMSIRRTIGMAPGPAEQSDTARTEVRLREALPAAALDEELAEGAALTPATCLARAQSLT
jgi:hypothetical protein